MFGHSRARRMVPSGAKRLPADQTERGQTVEPFQAAPPAELSTPGAGGAHRTDQKDERDAPKDDFDRGDGDPEKSDDRQNHGEKDKPKGRAHPSLD